jgi:hypothetical protein
MKELISFWRGGLQPPAQQRCLAAQWPKNTKWELVAMKNSKGDGQEEIGAGGQEGLARRRWRGRSGERSFVDLLIVWLLLGQMMPQTLKSMTMPKPPMENAWLSSLAHGLGQELRPVLHSLR